MKDTNGNEGRNSLRATLGASRQHAVAVRQVQRGVLQDRGGRAAGRHDDPDARCARARRGRVAPHFEAPAQGRGRAVPGKRRGENDGENEAERDGESGSDLLFSKT